MTMNQRTALLAASVLWGSTLSGVHAEPASTPSAEPGPLAADLPETGWDKFNDWDISGMLFPHVYLYGIGGGSTGDPGELAAGGHDPKRETISAQAIEPGLSLRTLYLEGFVNGVMFQDAAGDWDGEWEEAFAKLTNLPGGFELKGGQFLSRFGVLNAKHLHSWDFVDYDLAYGRFLGDDGLVLQGAELNWNLPLRSEPSFIMAATAGFGKPRGHEHSHGEESHAEHGVEGHDEHGHSEEANLTDDVVTARLLARYRPNDFHTLTVGTSWAGGENGYGRRTKVWGADLEYQWRERGLEPGGRMFRWRNEFLWRDAGIHLEAEEHHAEHDDDDEHAEHGHDGAHMPADIDEAGCYSTVAYTWNEHLDTALRVGWVEGVPALDLDERLRISPAVSYWLDDGRRVGARIQYNYDRLDAGDDEHSVWFQVSIALGSLAEVR